MSGPGRELSFARLALYTMGSATAVLTAVAAIIVVWRPGATAGLIAVAVGIIAAIAVMGMVSNRMVARALEADDQAGRASKSESAEERPE